MLIFVTTIVTFMYGVIVFMNHFNMTLKVEFLLAMEEAMGTMMSHG